MSDDPIRRVGEDTIEARGCPADEQSRTLTMVVTEAVHDEVSRLALDLRGNLSTVLADALSDFLRKHGRPPLPELANVGRKKRGRPSGGINGHR
jgi:hypothetical protein